MEKAVEGKKKRHPIKKALLWFVAIFFALLLVIAIYITRNFNQLLTDALLKSFDSSLVSDVYELKFDKLRVNLLQGNIKVFNVVFQPRSKPRQTYPYINSTIRLTANKILLTNVRILDLLKLGLLQLEKIEITEPEVELNIEDQVPIFFPFNDSTEIVLELDKDKRKPIKSFVLQKFELNNASLHVVNSAKQRDLKIKKLSVSVNDLVFKQLLGKDFISYNHVGISIGELTGRMKNESLKYLSFKDYSLSLDSITIEKSVDTLIYHFADFSTGISMVEIQTADSTYHISMESLQLLYKDKSIQLSGFSLKPNVSNAFLQSKSKFRKTNFSGDLNSLKIVGLNFDSLIFSRKLFIEEIKLDKIGLTLYKDKSKPVDKSKFPKYLGQIIASFPVPLIVKQLNATNINLTNIERKEDGKNAKVTVNKGKLLVKNITNLSPNGTLNLNVTAYLENKVSLNLQAAYSYARPEFSIVLKSGKFNLLDLNPLITAYAPTKINSGTVDNILLTANIYQKHSTGKLEFLYHDLIVDMKLSEKKWQNDVLAFAANTAIQTNNPPKGLPPRIVAFSADRDMNKGGFNIILKSFFAGMKETMIMSKENKKAYKQEKKKKKLLGK